MDLDNLFAFLADVSNGTRVPGTAATNQTIDEIGDRMDQLVGDLDEEVMYPYFKILLWTIFTKYD